MKVSNCCGASDRMIPTCDNSYSDIGLCPDCKDHCEFEEVGEEQTEGKKPMGTIQVSEEEYLYAVENYQGFCSQCEKFTNFNVEPDAKNYKCEECETYHVMGAEEALISGHIEFGDEE